MGKRQETKATDAEALWHFATAAYARDGVARACLAAQDEAGYDVNLLLFAAWRASRGAALTGADLERVDALCGPWQRDVVAPLRRLRRRWKRDAPDAAAYAAIKAVELEAERQQLAMLADLPLPSGAPGTARMPPGTAQADALLRANLAALCRHRGRREEDLDAFAQAVAGLRDSVGGEEPA